VVTLALAAAVLGLGDSPADPSDFEFFEKRVRPVLVEHCHRCHGPEKQKAELRLDSLAAVLTGGENGPIVVAGRPEESRLVRAIGYADVKLQMPPKGKLPDRDIEALREWVQRGLPWPRREADAVGAAATGDFDLEARRRSHWAWQAIRDPPLPSVADSAWLHETADAFILARLEAEQLSPAPPAEPPELARRLHFDLAGLPPPPDDASDFLAGESPLAYERLVDRLLASPRFAERWTRHWLDLVRYAETRGHEHDYVIPNAYQYRDYVLRALNADVPYEEFVVEHVAGDLLPSPRLDPESGANESVLGTGFWFLGEEVHSPVDIRQDEADRADNQIDVFSKAFLGLTVACARCHDHKFDAISTRDYYALAGFLQSSSYRQVSFESLENHREVAQALKALRAEWRPKLLREFAESSEEVLGRMPDYLAAAADLARAERSAAPDAHVTAAAARGLDAELLQRWSRHLQAARSTPDDPFHVRALLASSAAGDEAERLREIAAPLVKGWRVAAERASAAEKEVRVLVDYSTLRAEDWMQDGFTFGTGPARAGDVELSADPARPLRGVVTRGAARRDPVWLELSAPAGTQSEPAAFGAWSRPGRTLRTPTFELQSGKLHYLVSGAGFVYAVVDSHRLIQGPLHGRLLLEWKDEAQGKPRWVSHDLTPYRGHRLHLEFTPKAGSTAAVYIVAEADRAPQAEVLPSAIVVETLAASDWTSPRALAERLQTHIEEALRRLTSADGGDGEVWASLADWAVRHADLLRAKTSAAETLTASAAGFISAQEQLLSRLRTRSHTAPALLDGSGEDEYVFVRGKHTNRGPTVPRRFLEAIAGAEQPAVASGSGRLELARRLTDPANPFLPRVLVNRVWHHLFGRGIVATVDDFGAMGERPTHPELLDELAADFARGGGSLKKLMRSLVTSSAYRMSSRGSASALDRDPRNLLVHSMRPRRLEGEAVRDAILAVSGRLDLALLGPSVDIHLTEFLEGRGRPQSGPLDGAGRRSIYLAVRRNFLSPFLRVFDAPLPFSTVGRRNVSNVPTQALILLNDPFVVEQAKLWAASVAARRGTSARERVGDMYRAAFARSPHPHEEDAALDFLAEQQRVWGVGPERLDADPRPWSDLCHVLFNVKEFVYVP
jgi:cytochrome c553